jgi:hypothetical protein
MYRAALVALLVWFSSAAVASGQELPEGTYASSKEGCTKLKEKTVKELGQDLDFTVFSKKSVDANGQHCDFVSVTPRNATSWLATALCEEPGYTFPDLFAIVQKKSGDLSVTRMTLQQESYDESEEDISAFADDLDPSEMDNGESDDKAAGDDGAEGAAEEEDLNAFFRCESVKQ